MTTPAPKQPDTTPAAQIPAGVRIASTLCWVVGVLTILVGIAIEFPVISSGAGLPFIAVNAGAAAMVCVAAVQIRRQRKLGVRRR